MTQAIKKRESEIKGIIGVYDSKLDNFNDRSRNNKLNDIILDYLFRNISFINNNRLIKDFTLSDYHKISSEIHISTSIIKDTIDKFLINLKNFKSFLKSCKIRHDPKNLNRKIRIYLHKIHRIAPVFNYNRARKNLEILQSLLAKKNFWPTRSTQIAIVIYITDKNDENYPENKKILQKNIRTLCNSSAYAFHRTRNILNIS